MKSTKEVMKILGISRNTLKKRMTELNVFPLINETGSWEFSQEDIDVLQGNDTEPITPEITQKETHATTYDEIHDALNVLRETGMTVSVVLEFKPGYKFEMTNKTRKQRERLLTLYEEYQEAYYNKRKTILNTLDNEF